MSEAHFEASEASDPWETGTLISSWARLKRDSKASLGSEYECF